MKNTLKIWGSILLAILVNASSFGQVNFTRNDSVVVLSSIGDTLENPWAGGFNSVQFSEIDIDLDGIKDLFTFDRTGNKRSIFINAGTPNKIIYRHAPEYLHLLPEFHDWVILRDYNCDGKMDIFTYSNGGMAIYRNTSTSQLSFNLETSLLHSDYTPDAAPSFVNLYISSVDIPAIDDIDGDGDLDVLTFSISGSYIEYHKNLSMEKHGTCDSLDYQLRNKCWGFIKENLTGNSVTLYDTCSFNVNNPEKQSGGNKHAGSMLFTLDVDSNGNKDLVLSDVSFNNFTLLINQDTTTNKDASSIVLQDTLFPQNHTSSVAMDINIFPAGFYMDVNNDGVKDLVTSPNCYNGCSNYNNTWLYQNKHANNKPDFDLVKTSFIQEGMIEVGEGAHPVFFDYNADGLDDIIVGSYGIFNPAVGPLLYESGLYVYENVGTLTNPAFKLVDTDYMNISNMNLDLLGSRPTLGLAPTFGDIDGDLDLDMILGDYNGKIHLFRNNAGAGNPANFNLTQPDFMGVDVGAHATPLLYNLNNDSLIDLIIGKENGYFAYYENQGNTSMPNFVLITDSLGKINTRRQFDFQGNSNPIFVDSSGTTILYSGAKNGYIYKFGNIDGNLTGTFSIDSTYKNIWEGINSFVAVKDITNDGYLDMLVGNYSGGVAFYKGDTLTGVNVAPEAQLEDFINIYPNPTNASVTIDLGTHMKERTTVEILDLLGKSLLTKTIRNTLTVDLSEYSQGAYLIKVNAPNGTIVQKLIKN